MFNINYKKNYIYKLYLCKPNKDIICQINPIDLNFKQNFRDFNELEFTVNYYENDWQLNKDSRYNQLKSFYLIYMKIFDGKTLKYEEYFVIDTPNISQDGNSTQKILQCSSMQSTVFNNIKLRSYEDVKLLYDPYNLNSASAGLLNYMLNQLEYTWTIDYINEKYLNQYRTWDFSSSSYTDVFKTIEEEMICVVVFDNINNTISIYDPDEIGEDKNLIISNKNLLKNINVEDKSKEIITRLRCYGNNNLTVVKYNPLGQIFVDNFDWFLNNGYFSNELATAWHNYKLLVNSKQGIFTGYLNNLATLNDSLLLKQNQLKALQEDLTIIQQDLDVYKNFYSSNTIDYDARKIDENNKKNEIINKEIEIENVQNNINNINSLIMTLNDQLSYVNNFTLAQRQELIQYRKEDDLNVGTIDSEELLYEYAVKYLARKAVPPVDIDIDIIDLFSVQELQNMRSKIKVGDYVYINCPEVGFNYYQTRLVSLSHNPYNNSLSGTLSNQDKINTYTMSLLRDIITKQSKSSQTIDVNKYDYKQYVQEKSTIIYNGDIIDAENNKIIFGDNEITRRGFQGKDIGGYGAIQLKNDKIIFSSDNWETYFTLLSSNGLYLETIDKNARIVITPQYGFQIDRNFGTYENPNWSNTAYIDSFGDMVLAGRVQIGSGNSIFKADTNGIYLGDANFSFAPFRVTPQGTLYATDANISGNITGSSITSSTINVSTDVTVGNNITIGNQAVIEGAIKSIKFFSDITNFDRARIIAVGEADNKATLKLSASKNLELYTEDIVRIFSPNEFIVGVKDTFNIGTIFADSTEDASIEHNGSGNLNINHAGNGGIIINTDKDGNGKLSFFGQPPVSRQTATILSSPQSNSDFASDEYTENEQDMLNHLKQDIHDLYVKVNGLIGKLADGEGGAGNVGYGLFKVVN